MVTSEKDVEAMLPELEKLSAKTYQAKMLGLGITPGGVIEQQLRFAARKGMARVHLLRVDGQLISRSGTRTGTPSHPRGERLGGNRSRGRKLADKGAVTKFIRRLATRKDSD